MQISSLSVCLFGRSSASLFVCLWLVLQLECAEERPKCKRNRQNGAVTLLRCCLLTELAAMHTVCYRGICAGNTLFGRDRTERGAGGGWWGLRVRTNLRLQVNAAPSAKPFTTVFAAPSAKPFTTVFAAPSAKPFTTVFATPSAKPFTTAGCRRKARTVGSRLAGSQLPPGTRRHAPPPTVAADTTGGKSGRGREPPKSSARSTEQNSPMHEPRSKKRVKTVEEKKVVVPSRTGQKSQTPRSGALVPGRPPGKKGAVGPQARGKKV